MQEIAPSFIGYPSESELKIENNFQRGFVVNGYPARVSINWMDDIYSYDGDMDAALHIEPANERNALDELTAKSRSMKRSISQSLIKAPLSILQPCGVRLIF